VGTLSWTLNAEEREFVGIRIAEYRGRLCGKFLLVVEVTLKKCSLENRETGCTNLLLCLVRERLQRERALPP
jgi:hypothetical protein